MAISQQTVSFNIPPNSVAYEDSSWKYPIAVYSVSFISKANQEGDVINILSGPDTTVGAILEPVIANNTTTFKVSLTVINNVYPGYHIKLTDGNNYDDLGEVYQINKEDGTISVDNPPTVTYNHTTPTYVLTESNFIKNYEIGPTWKYDIGFSKIGAAYIPANTIIRTLYKNNSNEEKRFIGYIEYTC